MREQRAIEGKNVNIKAFYIDGWYPFACATEIDFVSDYELIERTGPNSGAWKEFGLRLGEWEFTLKTITHIVPPAGIGTFLTVFTALQESIRRQGLLLELSFIDKIGNAKTITGRAVIPNVNINAGAEGFSNDTIKFKGTGGYTLGSVISETPDNNNEMAYDVLDGDFTATEGQTSVVLSHLIGCELLGVFRGYPLDRVPYTGAAPAITEQQVAFAVDGSGLLTSGSLTFGAPLGAGEFVYYFYKKY